jgi:NitT/TauT family transport system permease protein
MTATQTAVPGAGPAGPHDIPPPLEDARPSLRTRIWRATWPPLAAAGLAIGIWQVVVWSGWKPEYVLPPPLTVFQDLAEGFAAGDFTEPIARTLGRAAVGFAIAMVIGTLLGLAVSRWRTLRAAFGSLITGLQTMPSIAWFPLAILLFGLSERAILFVVVLGAAPSIANGIISGVDDLQPSLLRAAKVLGARGVDLYRLIVVPAALPTYLAGLKQGWAFSWRSLMAGELLGVIPGSLGLGQLLQIEREFADASGVIGAMIVILVIGMVVDGIFAWVTNGVRRRRGLGALRL